METSVNILAMLQTAIAAGLIVLAGAWGLYAWLKHTGQLKDHDHRNKGQTH